MKRYNVRLEHDPLVPIGQLRLSAACRSGHEIKIIDEGSLGREEHIFVLDFFDPYGEAELAVRSHKPVEFWRRVPRFEENKNWRSGNV
jgi:hypothetical protein